MLTILQMVAVACLTLTTQAFAQTPLSALDCVEDAFGNQLCPTAAEVLEFYATTHAVVIEISDENAPVIGGGIAEDCRGPRDFEFSYILETNEDKGLDEKDWKLISSLPVYDLIHPSGSEPLVGFAITLGDLSNRQKELLAENYNLGPLVVNEAGDVMSLCELEAQLTTND